MLKPVVLSGNRCLDFSQRALVMGIVNCTPDSFFPESRYPEKDAAIEAALRMIEEGADILDIGGESTRPGSLPVEQKDEAERITPVIEAVRKHSDIPISVDTRKAGTAARALDAGADIINDVSALRNDPLMAGLAAERDVPVVLMHMKGSPLDMQQKPFYEDVLTEIIAFFKESLDSAHEAGIRDDRIILDPGIGFGKRLRDNLELLASVDRLCQMGFPVLIGASRKSFLKAVLDKEVEDRLAGSLAAGIYAVIKGASILRVHDVKETVDSLTVIYEIEKARSESG